MYRAILCVVFILFSKDIFAERIVPITPVCNVSAKVFSVERRWVPESEPEMGDYYYLKVKIYKVHRMRRQHGTGKKCTQSFREGMEVSLGGFTSHLVGQGDIREGDKINVDIYGILRDNSITTFYELAALSDRKTKIKKIK